MAVNITTRAAKGSALSFDEMDNNFLALKAAVEALQAGGGTVTPTLGALTPSTAFTIGTAVSGTLAGATSGSTITTNIPGITVNSAARSYSGTPTGSAQTIANAFVETLSGATGSPRSTAVTVAAAATPAPSFTTQPAASPSSGPVGTTFTGSDGAINNGTVSARQWLLNGTAISGATGASYVSAAAGTLTYRVTATGAGGSTSATSAGVTVSAAAPVADPVATSDMLPALTTSGASYHSVGSTSRLLPGFNNALAVANGAGVGTVSTTDIAASDLSGIMAVDGLLDQTGNNRNLFQGTAADRPTISAETTVARRIGVAIDGHTATTALTQGGISLPLTSSCDFFVMWPMASTQSRMYVQSNDSSNNVQHYVAGSGFSGVTGDGSTAATSSPGLYDSTQNSGSGTNFEPAMPIVLAVNRGPAAQDIWVNGAKVKSTTATPNAINLVQRYFGFFALNGDFVTRFTLSSQVSVSGTLSDADVSSVSAALAARSGIPFDYDVNIFFIGDSIGYGAAATNCRNLWHYLRPSLNKRCRFVNHSINGRFQAQSYRDRAFYEGTQFVTGKKNVAIIQLGINDIHANGSTGAALYNNTTVPYVAYLKAQGWTVMVNTLLPQNAHTSTSIENERVAYNNLVLANSAGADKVNDLTANTQMGPTSAPSDTSLYADGIHPTSYGYSLLAPTYASALNAVF